MKLSTRARYALRAMIVIAREGEEGKPVNLAEVARRTGISHRYLEQVAISLKNAKLLRAVAGKNGGHMLARPAEDIRLGEIVEAAIGEICVVDCVLDPENCGQSDKCSCRDLYSLVNKRILDTMNDFSLEDLEQGRIRVSE